MTAFVFRFLGFGKYVLGLVHYKIVFLSLTPSPPLSLSHTHTHTHKHLFVPSCHTRMAQQILFIFAYCVELVSKYGKELEFQTQKWLSGNSYNNFDENSIHLLENIVINHITKTIFRGFSMSYICKGYKKVCML
jgi:hypothetical protein